MTRKGDLSGGTQPVLSSAPIIAGNFSLTETLRNLRLPIDDQGNLWEIPVALVDPVQAGPIHAVNGLSAKNNTGLNGIQLQVANMGLFFSIANVKWNLAMEPDSTAVVSAVSANTNLVGAGGAGKQYRVFSCWLSVQATAALANDIQVTDGTNVLASIPGLGAAGNSSVSVSFGPNGMLTAANAAIATAASAYTNAKVSAGIVYGGPL